MYYDGDPLWAIEHTHVQIEMTHVLACSFLYSSVYTSDHLKIKLQSLTLLRNAQIWSFYPWVDTTQQLIDTCWAYHIDIHVIYIYTKIDEQRKYI